MRIHSVLAGVSGVRTEGVPLRLHWAQSSMEVWVVAQLRVIFPPQVAQLVSSLTGPLAQLGCSSGILGVPCMVATLECC